MGNNDIKQQILEHALNDIPFDGWSIDTFKNAATQCGHDEMMVSALFPSGLHDTLKYFSEWADVKMLDRLPEKQNGDLRTHEKIITAIEARLSILTPYKDCVRESAKLLARPQYARIGIQITWDCADVIWNWAGDTAADYNHYTKRTLLSGVIASTVLYWLQDDSENHAKTSEFLERRIQNALSLGKNSAPIVKPVASLFERFIVRKNA